jgi:hypothetical protein
VKTVLILERLLGDVDDVVGGGLEEFVVFVGVAHLDRRLAGVVDLGGRGRSVEIDRNDHHAVASVGDPEARLVRVGGIFVLAQKPGPADVGQLVFAERALQPNLLLRSIGRLRGFADISAREVRVIGGGTA